MAFSPSTLFDVRPEATALTQNMVGIGMNFAAKANPSAPIEETLVHASVVGMDEHDLRVLAVLTTWLGVHHEHINVNRLAECVSAQASERVSIYWAAIMLWLFKGRHLARVYSHPPLDLLPVGTDFQIARRGEDLRFANSALKVPAGTLRDRSADVLPPEILMRRHEGYRRRVRLGPMGCMLVLKSRDKRDSEAVAIRLLAGVE